MERRVYEALVSRGVESYLPELVCSAAGRRRSRSVPFFPRYLFSRLSLANELLWVRWLPGLIHVVSFGDTPAIVDDRLIEMLKANLAECAQEKATQGQLRPGERVLVVEGPLKGFEAVFDQHLSSSGRVKILIEFLRRTTPCIIEASQIARIN